MLNHQDLVDHLHRLVVSFDGDLGELAEDIADVIELLEQVVSGSAGLQLVLIRSGLPVTLDATPLADLGDPAMSSMRMSLPLVSGGPEPVGKVVLYSTEPGAFVDLAAELAPFLNGTGGPVAAVELDADLPLVPGGPLPTGLDDLITVNRAVGVLIDLGKHPDGAHEALCSQAAAHGLTPVALARQLLGRRRAS